jgi:heat-inducible transcriptional repressor
VDELSQRQQDILGFVVREYIATAKAASSDTICQSCGLGVSSATIRNELAALADQGYLMQPHTSAGRVPTAKGYRYFVERLMQRSELPVSEQTMIRHQFHQVSQDLDQWMRLAATVLAKMSQSASVIAAPQSRQVHFRHVELISISEATGLMILVLQDGSIHQQMMVYSNPVTQDQLSRVSNRLNAQFVNLDTAQARTRSLGESGGEDEALVVEVSRRMVDVMHGYESQSGREIYRDGLVHILRQPEFEEIERARHVVQVLEQDSALEAIFGRAQLANGVQVIIGSEDNSDDIRDCSLVLSGYGLLGEADGVVGVLGPMRMPYGRAVSAVRYVAGLMNDLLHSLYGE